MTDGAGRRRHQPDPIGGGHGRGRRRVARLRRPAHGRHRRRARHHLPRATRSRRPTASPTCSSSCSPPARCPRCSCRPSSTCSIGASSGGPRRSPAACCRSRWSGSASCRVARASCSRPQLARRAHRRRRRPGRSPRTSGSWPPSCCASSSRRCCSTRSARSTTAVLHARGSFALTAVAPIGNTVVLVVAHARLPRDGRRRPRPRPLDTVSGSCLALGGTLGVAAFVGVPAVGLRLSGFRLRLGVRRALARPRRAVACSGCRAGRRCSTPAPASCSPPRWSRRAGVAGGVVAYQLAMVVFLAPYGIVAQPIHTAVLPAPGGRGRRRRRRAGPARRPSGGRPTPWSSVTVPVAAGPRRAVRCRSCAVLAFGEAAEGDGPELLGGALLGLAVGVPVYGGVPAAHPGRLRARRQPHAGARLARLGGARRGRRWWSAAAPPTAPTAWSPSAAAHSPAYALGAAWLGRPPAAARRDPSWHLAQLRPVALAVAAGAAWPGLAMEAWSPEGRGPTLARASS